MSVLLTRTGVETSFAPGEFDAMQENYRRSHWLILRSLIEPDLLDGLMNQVHGSKFEQVVHEKVGIEACMRNDATLEQLMFLTNRKELFRVIEHLTGCDEIGSFHGRVYRLSPTEGHYDSWHNDLRDTRLVAMSVNLSPAPYEGGALQLRTRQGIVAEVENNTSPGDALVFRLSRELLHRVAPVSGLVPKTKFAGWFRARRDGFMSPFNVRSN